MDNSNEDFWLQISTDGGSSFTTVEEWNRDDEFVNDERYFDQKVIEGPFSANTQLRFRCDASGNSDWVYIDDVEISGCSTGTGSRTAVVKTKSVSEVQGLSTKRQFNLDMDVFPNPFTDIINIEITGHELYTKGQVEVFDISGKIVYQRNFESQRSIQINDLNVSTGQYFIKMILDNEVITKKLIRIK